MVFLAVLFLLSACTHSDAFYLPGVAPRDFLDGDPVELKVDKLTSVHTQIPYDYYHLPFCVPVGGVKDTRENLGELLMGDRIENSDYVIEMARDVSCRVLCSAQYSSAQLDMFAEFIRDDYSISWIVDNLPAGTPLDDTRTFYASGFKLGFLGDPSYRSDVASGEVYVNNHVHMRFKYHVEPSGAKRIVAFEVTPESLQHTAELNKDGVPATCSRHDVPPAQPVTFPGAAPNATVTIVWTYSVSWSESDILWHNRWDAYLNHVDKPLHWFSVVNSLIIVVFLSGMIALILMRTLRNDFNDVRHLAPEDEEAEEIGWKLIHGDVFRRPGGITLLAALVGSGIQIFATAITVLTFALLGFLSPSNRGALVSAFVSVFCLMGPLAGYAAVRLYLLYSGDRWRRCACTTALFFPGVVLSIFLVLDVLVLSVHSSGAVPATSLFEIGAMWLLIQTPLVILGAYFASRFAPLELPVRVKPLSRSIPRQSWYVGATFSVLTGGVLPFGAVFIELLFVLSAVWGHQFYYVFGFLAVVFVILVVTCAEISITMCYFQLCAEDWRWCWRAWLTPAATGLYMFLYSGFYFGSKLSIAKPLSAFVYFGYTLIISLFFTAICGMIGMLSCLYFVYKIYSQLKVD